jgi:hypothetical protein
VRLAVASCLLAAGCLAGARYRVAPPLVEQVAHMPAAERAGVAVPAVRDKGGAEVRLRGDTLRLEPMPSAAPDGVHLTAAAPSRMAQAGIILTFLGTPVSIVGTILLLATHGATQTAGIAMAAGAEPFMQAGTILWIVGLLQRPQEVAAGRADLRYLQPGQ